ncbi:DNA-packaging protein [Gimibacter soli]|uniref:Terminase family protein n=1 Tax=Gimibacter soli TaxID=3024400 RepID=A0AAE9XUS2_9PROT|nr:terminase family protein [Gimibacter soli]WCL55780.1 terminase family protein [Gimibacter soli]
MKSSLARFSRPALKKLIRGLSDEETALLFYDWPFWARPEQLAPAGDWRCWLVLAGRGFGKTRSGSEWVRGLVEGGAARRLALVAPTLGDARAVMVEGESGLLAISPPWARPVFEPSKRLLTWPNGAVATLFGAEEPDRLSGPQFDAAWCDELCAWGRADETLDMLRFGLRLGDAPRLLVTTTPRPMPLLKRLMADRATAVTRGRTRDNSANLAAGFLDEITRKYGGTRLGRQELDAEILEDTPGALFARDRIETLRVSGVPEMQRIVVALDPPVTSGETADECGLVAAGLGVDGHGYVLADQSSRGLTPLEWAARAVDLYHELQADRIVAEGNQGGDLVPALIGQVDASVPVKRVHARVGKRLRAEPVAALYEQGRVHHTACFPALEDQMANFTGSLPGGASPDRLDALVWALTDLMLTQPVNLNMRML